MLKRSALLLALPLALSAQEDPFLFPESPLPSTATRVAVGGYDQAFSDGLGHWKGWTVEGTIYPVDQGPWVLAATGFDRPEGRGTMFTLGKYLLVGEASSLYLGLSSGTNADFLPQARVDLDARLDLGAGWKFDLAGALSRFTQDQEIRMLQAGPAFVGETWSLSVRMQHLTYEPGGESDTGGILGFRLGNDDFGVWHSLQVAAGRGILESTAPGGLASSSTGSLSGWGGRYGRRSAATDPVTSPTDPASTLTDTTDALPQERLVSLTGHWPVTDRFAVKAEATWGEKVSTFRFWGGSLQLIATF